MGGKPWDIAERTIFTINLLSDAILLEQGWLPTQELSPAMLKEETRIDATLLRSFTQTQTVGGWAVLWQRHKLPQLAVGMGSLYVFQANQPLTHTECEALARLQLRGIGERRREGYGQVRICDEFHLPDPPGSKWEIEHDEQGLLRTPA
jgi:CRISPR-associated protein Csx10